MGVKSIQILGGGKKRRGYFVWTCEEEKKLA